MDCALCKKPIQKFDPAFNEMTLADGTRVTLCASCVDSFLKWQGAVIAKLFPTSGMKKRFAKK